MENNATQEASKTSSDDFLPWDNLDRITAKEKSSHLEVGEPKTQPFSSDGVNLIQFQSLLDESDEAVSVTEEECGETAQEALTKRFIVQQDPYTREFVRKFWTFFLSLSFLVILTMSGLILGLFQLSREFGMEDCFQDEIVTYMAAGFLGASLMIGIPCCLMAFTDLEDAVNEMFSSMLEALSEQFEAI